MHQMQETVFLSFHKSFPVSGVQDVAYGCPDSSCILSSVCFASAYKSNVIISHYVSGRINCKRILVTAAFQHNLWNKSNSKSKLCKCKDGFVTFCFCGNYRFYVAAFCPFVKASAGKSCFWKNKRNRRNYVLRRTSHIKI